MLKELILSNIILIENTHIHFEEGFTVLSGETGSGKSAILEGLHLISGCKTDVGLIRHGEDKLASTAIFDLSKLPSCKSFLEGKGIDAKDDLLIIKREISASGKSRAFINHQPVQLQLLKELKEQLLEIVNQHANFRLFDTGQHLQFLDIYGNLLPLVSSYKQAWQNKCILDKELQTLQKTLPQALEEMHHCKKAIAEIEEAAPKEGEEEELFKQYSLLASSHERLQACHALEAGLGPEKGALALMNRSKHVFAALQEKDPSLSNEFSLFPQVLLELEELFYSLRKYTSHIQSDPILLESLNKRLTLLAALKRKYGAALEEVNAHLEEQKRRLHTLQNIDSEIENLKEQYGAAEKIVETLAKELTANRKGASALLESAMTAQLEELNMKCAKFHVVFTPSLLSESGGEKVEFYLDSNLGEKKVPLKEGASGGELARVLLALHVLLAGKEGIGTLIFDEIDANIGGSTASMIGNKLKSLGKSLQVLCITHFPQVAKCADHHLGIAKSTQGGRTISQIIALSFNDRKEELLRMAGRA
jgi:DNA repair protein RecN (Recombination protein N)